MQVEKSLRLNLQAVAMCAVFDIQCGLFREILPAM